MLSSTEAFYVIWKPFCSRDIKTYLVSRVRARAISELFFWSGGGPTAATNGTRSEVLTICRETSVQRGAHYGPGPVLLSYESANIRAKRHYDLARKFAIIIQAHAPARI